MATEGLYHPPEQDLLLVPKDLVGLEVIGGLGVDLLRDGEEPVE